MPVSLPGESQGQRSLVGCPLWGCIETDVTEATAAAAAASLHGLLKVILLINIKAGN